MPNGLITFALEINAALCWKLSRKHYLKYQKAGNAYSKQRHSVLTDRWRMKALASEKANEAYACELQK